MSASSITQSPAKCESAGVPWDWVRAGADTDIDSPVYNQARAAVRAGVSAETARKDAERYALESRVDKLLAKARAGRARDWREVRKLHVALDESVKRGVWTWREVWLEFLRGRLDEVADCMAEDWDCLAAGVCDE